MACTLPKDHKFYSYTVLILLKYETAIEEKAHVLESLNNFVAFILVTSRVPWALKHPY